MKRFPLMVLPALLALASCDNNDNGAEVPVVTGPKLQSETWHIEGSKGFRPLQQSLYYYNNAGQLTLKEYYTYDVVEKKFDIFSETRFTYENNKLVKSDETLQGSAHQTTHYTYTGDKLTHIKIDSGVDTDISITYLPNDSIKAQYDHSNGRWFTAKFAAPGGNIAYEQTVNDSHQLSSEVRHTYDGHVNPYSLLDLPDPFFSSTSKHNKLTTESEYFTESRPTSVPVTYTYDYDADGLPNAKHITYKSYPGGEVTSRAKVFFKYHR